MADLLKWIRACIAFSLVASWAAMVWATDPVPLESAYWRFEEGAGNANTTVSPPNMDVVKDWTNDNDLRPPAVTDTIAVAPLWSDLVPPTPLRSGATNTSSISFTGQSQLATSEKPIDNGIIAPGAGFTLEAAFQTSAVTFPGGPYQSIIVKQGQPADDGVLPKNDIEKLPTLTLKIRGDNGKLQFEEFDGAKNLVSVSSQAVILPNQWYYAAVVNDGSQMQLYLDSNDGNGYQLQSTVAVSGGALYQTHKTNGNPDWYALWAVGRGDYDGSADWFNGFIDEVRLTNSVLTPADFLFAPIPGDFNRDGLVDGADYVVWRKTINTPETYAEWRAHFGYPSGSGAGSVTGTAAVPEATSAFLILIAAGLTLTRRSVVPRG